MGEKRTAFNFNFGKIDVEAFLGEAQIRLRDYARNLPRLLVADDIGERIDLLSRIEPMPPRVSPID